MNGPRSHSHRAAWHRSFLRGFTLAELIVVVLIVGILSAVAIPRMSGSLVRYRVESAASRLTHDLEFARRHAKLSSTAQTVAFDVNGNSYVIAGLADLDHPDAEYEVQLDEPPYEVWIISVDFNTDSEMEFDGYGVPNYGGSVVIGAGGFQITVSVDAQSGGVTRADGGMAPTGPPEIPEG